LIVAFSVGLASVLTGIGILMVYAGRLFERIPVGGRVIKALPVASAFIITIVGIGLTLQALAQTGILQTITVASSGLF
jgi:multisubunit Na+/H+ antiporter MnhC subunit